MNILLTNKSWHDALFKNLENKYGADQWIRISDNNFFSREYLKSINAKKIFIPHWSKIIPREIFSEFECILFHMTDLPYGRGGSPLQNLIIKGHSETKITAIRVEKGIDKGPIYIKKDLSLQGTASEIFERSAEIIFEMICEIDFQKIEPKKQMGKVTYFNRRNEKQSDLGLIEKLDKMYDHIRMLDCEGYPNAFIENENFLFKFTNANLINEKELKADVRIIKKQ